MTLDDFVGAAPDEVGLRAADFVPYFGKRAYETRVAHLRFSEKARVIEDRIDDLGFLQGTYMTVVGLCAFYVLSVYFPLK